MNASLRRGVSGLVVLAVVAAADVVWACPVCFGQSDAPMAQGVNWAVLFLMAVTGGVLFAFVSFFVYLFKRSRMALDDGIDAPASARQEGSF